MVVGGVVEIGDGGETLAVGIPGVGQELTGLLTVLLILLGGGGGGPVVAAHGAEVGITGHIAHAGGHKAGGRDLAGLGHVVHDILAVDG